MANAAIIILTLFWICLFLFYLVVRFMEWKAGDGYWLARVLWPAKTNELYPKKNPLSRGKAGGSVE